MTTRERIERQMRLELVDRLPILGGWLTSVEHYIELAGVSAEAYYADPVGVAAKAYAALHCDGIPSLHLPMPPDYSYYHAEHRRQQQQVVGREFPTPEAVLAYVESLPDPGELPVVFDAQAFYDKTLADMREHQRRFGDIVWMPANWQADGFFMWFETFGYSMFYLALGMYPEPMRRLFEYAAAEAFLRNQVLARLYSEHGLCRLMLMGQDICGQRGPTVSRKFLEWYFELGKEAVRPLIDGGFKLIWHSDGHVLPIVDLILALGVHGFQGFQWETGTTIEKLARQRSVRGERLLFFSGISISRTLIQGTPDDVRQDIERDIAATDGGKGLFLFTSNTILPDSPIANIRAAYDYAYQRRLQA